MKRNIVAALWLVFLTASFASAQPACGSYARKPVRKPAPLGSYLYGWRDAQAIAAEADQFVIYRQEWYLDGTKPGPYGSYHLQRIVERLPSVPFPVIIEVDMRDEKINLARKTFVVNQLLAAGITDAPARVIVGYPRAEGLFGDEAARIFLQRFGAGQTGGTMGTGGGAYGGAGFGVPGGGLMGGFRGY